MIHCHVHILPTWQNKHINAYIPSHYWTLYEANISGESRLVLGVRIRFVLYHVLAVQFPLAVLAAEIDPITSADLVAEYEIALKENKEVFRIGILVFTIFARIKGCWNMMMQWFLGWL